MIQQKHILATGVLLALLASIVGVSMLAGGAGAQEQQPDLLDGPVDATLSPGDTLRIEGNWTAAGEANITVTAQEKINITVDNQTESINSLTELWPDRGLSLSATSDEINNSETGYYWDTETLNVTGANITSFYDADGINESFNVSLDLDDGADTASLNQTAVSVDSETGSLGGLFEGTDRQRIIIGLGLLAGIWLLFVRD